MIFERFGVLIWFGGEGGGGIQEIDLEKVMGTAPKSAVYQQTLDLGQAGWIE